MIWGPPHEKSDPPVSVSPRVEEEPQGRPHPCSFSIVQKPKYSLISIYPPHLLPCLLPPSASFFRYCLWFLSPPKHLFLDCGSWQTVKTTVWLWLTHPAINNWWVFACWQPSSFRHAHFDRSFFHDADCYCFSSPWLREGGREGGR